MKNFVSKIRKKLSKNKPRCGTTKTSAVFKSCDFCSRALKRMFVYTKRKSSYFVWRFHCFFRKKRYQFSQLCVNYKNHDTKFNFINKYWLSWCTKQTHPTSKWTKSRASQTNHRKLIYILPYIFFSCLNLKISHPRNHVPLHLSQLSRMKEKNSSGFFSFDHMTIIDAHSLSWNLRRLCVSRNKHRVINCTVLTISFNWCRGLRRRHCSLIQKYSMWWHFL